MKLQDFINDQIEKPIGLFSGYLFFTLLLIALNPLLPVSTKLTFWIILSGILFIWSIVWYCLRTSLPSNKKGRIGIIVSITAENDNQKIRLKDDFLKRLHDQAAKNGIDSVVNFIQIGSTKNTRVNNILTDYTVKSRYESQDSIEVKKSVKRFFRLKNTVNGSFYVWGSIKERKDVENKYYLELNGLILHSTLEDPIKSRLSAEFNKVWARSINFQEKIELKGFLLSADLIFIAIEYIIGLAAFFVGNVELAEKLHSKLEVEINDIHDPFPNIRHIKKSLSDLIPIECNIAAAIQLHRADPIRSEEYLKKSLQRIPDNYGALIALSVLQFRFKEDAQSALSSVRKAKKNAGVDGTWRYNEAFLLMFLDRFNEALPLYHEITRINFPSEDRVLSEILEFNKTMIKNQPKFYQSYYILGFLFYRKVGNIPEAFFYFDHFIANCNEQKFKPLTDKAKKYLDDINLILQLE